MTKSILCVDDSVTMQTVCEITFRASDFAYVGARSAEEAVQKARATRPALILADASLGAGSGYDLCQTLKSSQDSANIPVLIMCGNSAAFDEARGKQVGADGHVVKPWDTQAMLDQVAAAIGKAASGVARPGGGAAASPAQPGAPAAARPAPPRAATPAPVAPARAATPAPVAAAPARAATPAPVAPARAATPAPIAAAPAQRPSAPRAATPVPGAAPRAAAPAPVAAADLPRPPPGMTRPPMIRGVPSKRPGTAVPVAQGAGPGAAMAAAGPPRSATIMGMPTMQMPAPTSKPPGVTAISAAPVAPAFTQSAAAPMAPMRPSPERTPAPTPISNPAAAQQVAARVAQAVPAAAAAAARSAGLDPAGPEMAALVRLSREVIEQVVWEVVPDLAEQIIRENLDRLAKGR
jgi:CheY-like chemotaxis protein